MSIDDRLDRLERRVAVLETLVRQLAAASDRAAGAAPAEPVAPAPPALGPASAPAPVSDRPSPSPPPGSDREAPLPPPRPSPVGAGRGAGSWGDWLTAEEWIGQRGLLAVGVVALILAAGYLLKLSFDRGWISPLMRCVGGALAGGVVGAVGWRLQARYRTYGAALIGCGAAIVYLCVWAAARLYGLLPPTTAIVGMALVSVSLAAIAYAIDVEALGATAALGAFFAPVVLGREPANADLLFLYLACMAAGLGAVAARRRWRIAMFVVAASYFGLGAHAAFESRRAWPPGMLAFAVFGGTGGLYVGLRERWWETRFLSFWGGWMVLGAASARLEAGWAILLAGLVLAAPVWIHGLRHPDYLPIRLGSRGTGGWSLGEALYFLATPVLLRWAVGETAPRWFSANPGAAEAILAAGYLLAGYVRPRRAFAVVGVVAAAAAAAQRWDGVAVVAAWLALAVVWAALDHLLRRDDGRWYALGTYAAAILALPQTADLRPYDAAAFADAWALTVWAAAAVAAALAAGLWKPAGDPFLAQRIRSALWVVAGTIVLLGGTAEIPRWFRQRDLPVETAALSANLAVSAWWLVAAAALVTLGFRRRVKALRVAGLVVAGLAVGKVLVFDLSTLDALYRVASVFILGLVSLSLAYLYHRQARTETR